MSATRLVYGVNPVRELLASKPRTIEAVFVAEHATGAGVREVREACARARVEVEARSREALDALVGADAVHQGVVAVAGAYAYASPADCLAAAAARGEAPLLVALDGVQDPRNLGAVLRAAHALGAHGVVIPQDRAAGVTPGVVKASAGATEHVPVARVVNLARALETLKKAGCWTVGAVPEGGEPPWAVDLRVPTVLVLGSEGAGLRRLTARGCDFTVTIPMGGRVGSLNVAVAAGICLAEATRQRAGTGSPARE